MTQPEPVQQWASYPTGAGEWRLRAFGAFVQDLEVDLTANRPTAITDLLACCTFPDADRDLLWDLPVGRRIECLLTLAALDGAEQFDADLRCARCTQTFEVTFTVDELLEVGRRADRTMVELRVDGQTLRFRRPTGRDQLAWQARSYPDEASAVTAMIASLAVDGGVAPPDALEAALDEADPLLRAPVEAACPDCGRHAASEIDLAGLALARMCGAQDTLLSTVDLLASHYHWSETEILSVPAWRRARYVELLQRERQ